MINNINKIEKYIVSFFIFVVSYYLIKDSNKTILPYFTYCNIKINYFLWLFFILPINILVGYKKILENEKSEIMVRKTNKKKIAFKIIKELFKSTLIITFFILFCFIININFSKKIIFEIGYVKGFFYITDMLYFFIVTIKYIMLIFCFQLFQFFLHISCGRKKQILYMVTSIVITYLSMFLELPGIINYLRPSVNTFDFYLFENIYECIVVSAIYYFFIILLITNFILKKIIKVDIGVQYE